MRAGFAYPLAMGLRWSGGQYSLWRSAFALTLAIHACIAGGTEAFAIVPLAIVLALGWHDRFAALALAAFEFHGGSWTLSALLVLHACARPAPYLSLDARERADPAGGWILPRWLVLARWALLGLHLGELLGRHAPPHFETWVLLLSCFDPSWIPPKSERAREQLFFDGECGLCHGFVRLILAEDPSGRSFTFAPLQGPTTLRAFSAEERRALPDSAVVRTEDGRLLTRSRAILHGLARLGGLWRIAAWIALLIPNALRDVLYDLVAKSRRHWFAKPLDLCPMHPAHLARRFEA